MTQQPDWLSETGPLAPPVPLQAQPLPTGRRSLVLIGLMGAGKSAIGRRLARLMGLPFVDSDKQIEEAAGRSIAEIFTQYGEPAFRDLERRVLARLMAEERSVVASGGGAFMHPDTRRLVKERGLSIWMRADLDTLVERTGRRNTRPLLRGGDPRAVLARLMEERYPIYGEADLAFDSDSAAPDETAARLHRTVRAYLDSLP